MYSVSENFHTRVYENSPDTQVLLKFVDGTVFSNADINLSSGIQIIEAANMEEELTIGSCLSSSFTGTLMNFDGLLDTYSYGECSVSIGVKTTVNAFQFPTANTCVVSGSNTFTGHSSAPYLRLNGSAYSSQPSFAVQSIIVNNGKVMCINSTGVTWKESGYGEVVNTGAFMTAKYLLLARSHTGILIDSNIITTFATSGVISTYEFAKLGTFFLSAPKKRKQKLVQIDASYDRMSLFNKRANDFISAITYPITIGQLYTSLCSFVGVSYATSTFTNSTVSVNSVAIDTTQELTALDVLKWIAQASCSFARFNREGLLELAWFQSQTVTITEENTISTETADYYVHKLDKLEILSSETGLNTVVGTGFNSYVIINNPLLHGAVFSDVYTYGQAIYNKLNALPVFFPINAVAVCDWSLQAGDIINIVSGGVTYTLPIYCQTISWKGHCYVSYESTGSEYQPVISKEAREQYTSGKQLYEVTQAANNSVQKGVPCYGAEINDTEGFKSTKTDGSSAKFNADQLGFYDPSNNMVGGMAYVNGFFAMLAKILMDSATSLTYIKLDDFTPPFGDELPGFTMYSKYPDLSSFVPVLKIGGWSNADNTAGDIVLVNAYGTAFMLTGGATYILDNNGNTCANSAHMQSGSCVLNSASAVSVTFSEAFQGVPVVMLTIRQSGSINSVPRVTAVSATGFSAIMGGTGVSGIVVDWLAVYPSDPTI